MNNQKNNPFAEKFAFAERVKGKALAVLGALFACGKRLAPTEPAGETGGIGTPTLFPPLLR